MAVSRRSVRLGRVVAQLEMRFANGGFGPYPPIILDGQLPRKTQKLVSQLYWRLLRWENELNSTHIGGWLN